MFSQGEIQNDDILAYYKKYTFLNTWNMSNNNYSSDNSSVYYYGGSAGLILAIIAGCLRIWLRTWICCATKTTTRRKYNN
ncbi:hypothetical protein NQ315_007270 [Exocentrus adspersus]|uniref:Uncharacterized protein n=1 Tax=Exocentrus adspersus TaxID=1586481 RepID=A0AAV8WCZ1_9CUCU|nr:hypothetical protein NQ315_007270 [Exocentrus adspersus]